MSASVTHQPNFNCTCIGDLHTWLAHGEDGAVGKTLNAFDTTINVRTDKDELLVITLSKLRSPVNLNVTPGNDNIGFKQIVGEFANVRIQNGNLGEQRRRALSIGNAVIILGEHDKFRNQFSRLEPNSIQIFANNGERIFSALESQAQVNRFGCLLNPDITTKGLFAGFVDKLISINSTRDQEKLDDRILKGLLELCGKGPGFTPAGDDFIAGYLAMSNWLRGAMNLGDAIIPGNDFSLLTTWTSFKLIEYGARNLLDEQVQRMINCVAHNDIDAYIDAASVISKRGHTSGIDFASGMTIALFAAAERVFKTSVLKSALQVLDS